MVDRIDFELVAPEQLLVQQPVEMVVIPGSEGYYGVLREHIPMITTVLPGVLEIWDEGHVTERIFVAGGFAEVTQQRVTVLVDQAIKVRDINREEAEKAAANLTEDLEDAETPEEREVIEARLAIAKAKVDAVDRFAALSHG